MSKEHFQTPWHVPTPLHSSQERWQAGKWAGPGEHTLNLALSPLCTSALSSGCQGAGLGQNWGSSIAPCRGCSPAVPRDGPSALCLLCCWVFFAISAAQPGNVFVSLPLTPSRVFPPQRSSFVQSPLRKAATLQLEEIQFLSLCSGSLRQTGAARGNREDSFCGLCRKW